MRSGSGPADAAAAFSAAGSAAAGSVASAAAAPPVPSAAGAAEPPPAAAPAEMAPAGRCPSTCTLSLRRLAGASTTSCAGGGWESAACKVSGKEGWRATLSRSLAAAQEAISSHQFQCCTGCPDAYGLCRRQQVSPTHPVEGGHLDLAQRTQRSHFGLHTVKAAGWALLCSCEHGGVGL